MKECDYVYCRNCGNQLGYKDQYCGACGEKTNIVVNTTTTATTNGKRTDMEPVLFCIFGVFAPLICLIVSLLVRKDKPEAAKIGIIVSAVRLFLSFLQIIPYIIKALT